MSLECSIPQFLLQPLEGQVMLACSVLSLEGLHGAKRFMWLQPNLDVIQQGGGNSLHVWKHQVLGPSQLGARAWGGFAMWGGRQVLLRLSREMLPSSGSQCPALQSPRQAPVPTDRSARPGAAAAGLLAGFEYPQASQGLCPPGPKVHAGASDAWLHPCGSLHHLDLPFPS